MHFDPANGNKPTQVTVKTGTLAAPTQHNPQRPCFRFDGWTLDGRPFDSRTPILQDTTLKAKWTKITDWTLSPNHGPASGARLTINPPDRREPQFASIQTSEDQIVSLTGDGRIYTWTQDGTPKQVPPPTQAPDGFHYLQVSAGSHRQAALGSDQQIYTWASGQSTPIILKTSQNTQFTSISLNDDLLLAVDRQGQVHTFQDSQNPKPDEQETTRLPGKAQAVTAVTAASRILALDSDGQAWAWDAGKTGSAKPERVKQDPRTHTVQAQPLSRGFLLLDSKGRARYLADSTTSPTAAGLPDGVQASRITANNDQAIITDTDGHVWAWKPGKAPIRADKGEQAYVQAATAGSRITANDKLGGIFTWSLDEQGKGGKPDRIYTSTAPILETASMDGQPLRLIKNNGSWQADMPARKPGPAAILIAGRQDGQPFTKSLKYTVDQPLTRGTEPRSTLTVRFNTGGGKPEPADQHFPTTNGRVKRPSPDPTRQGFLFDGWFTGEVAYDFSRPVTRDLTLTAKWTPASRNSSWSISPNKGSQLGREPTTITPPDSASQGIRFSQVSGSQAGISSLAVSSDGNAYAWGYNNWGQLGDGTYTDRSTPVMVKKPDRNTYPDLPKDFTYLQVSAGGYHSLALGSDGNAYAWGNSGYGQLGDAGSYRHAPVRVKMPDRNTYPDLPKDFTYLQVSAGGYHSLALGSDGNAYAWGNSGYGQLGDAGSYRHAPVRVKMPDRNTYPDLPKDFTYLQVSAGDQHSLALGSDGNVYAWGDNGDGQLGDGTVSFVGRHTPVRVKTPDRNTYPDLPKDFTYLQVSAGWSYSLALGSDGNAYAWGYNDRGQLGDGTTGTSRSTPVMVRTPDRSTYPDLPKDFTYLQVSAGCQHSLALGSDGNAYAWGFNSNGELGDRTTTDRHTPVRVKTPDRNTYPDLPKDFTYLQVSAGYEDSLALGSDGYAYAWGDNYYGNLGNNTASGHSDANPVPMRVRDPANPTDKSRGLRAAQVSAGLYYSLAVGSDGTAYAWGSNSKGQLGNNSYSNSTVPVPVVFNLQLVITGVRFDSNAGTNLTRGDSNSVTVLTPAHRPGTVTVSVDYTLGGAGSTLTDTSLRYTYLPAGVLPRAGGEGILLALTTGMTGMGGVLASRRHRREQHQLSHASHE
ncbi:InlB B-repeat-containing protein [Bifidobacterium asteroides]|uniref:RCC1 domain-containing protein n=1 Tax=Bifidobacterium asteroides TaxID=1684 RepID=UPI002D219C3B|nr:InlB B-repeat-containing protein [Bifidobacterium asteroides]